MKSNTYQNNGRVFCTCFGEDRRECDWRKIVDFFVPLRMGYGLVWQSRRQAGLTCHSPPFAIGRCRSFMLCELGEKWMHDGLIYRNCMGTAFAFDFPPDGVDVMGEYFAFLRG